MDSQLADQLPGPARFANILPCGRATYAGRCVARLALILPERFALEAPLHQSASFFWDVADAAMSKTAQKVPADKVARFVGSSGTLQGWGAAARLGTAVRSLAWMFSDHYVWDQASREALLSNLMPSEGSDVWTIQDQSLRLVQLVAQAHGNSPDSIGQIAEGVAALLDHELGLIESAQSAEEFARRLSSLNTTEGLLGGILDDLARKKFEGNPEFLPRLRQLFGEGT